MLNNGSCIGGVTETTNKTQKPEPCPNSMVWVEEKKKNKVSYIQKGEE